MDIRPIKNDKDHAEAIERIESLWDAKDGTPEADALDVLATLVDAYENERWAVAAVDPIETIQLHMQATGRTQNDLAQLIGSRSRASEIMARIRPLTINMIRELSDEWHLPAGLLLLPYNLKKPKADAPVGKITRPQKSTRKSARRQKPTSRKKVAEYA